MFEFLLDTGKFEADVVMAELNGAIIGYALRKNVNFRMRGGGGGDWILNKYKNLDCSGARVSSTTSRMILLEIIYLIDSFVRAYLKQIMMH